MADLNDRHASGQTITRSWLNSFARTVREQFADYVIRKIPINSATPVGIVARTAAYRLKDANQLRRFLRGENPCILCRYITNMEVDEPRYQTRYVTPHHYAATFRFFEQRPAELSYEQIGQVPGTLIPGTQKLSFLVPSGVEVDLRSLATVPWKLFGYQDLNDWYEVDAESGLASVERNRW